ncbi:hypothetical protein HZF24_06835 [Sedimentibacter hydroxybenzoicus DSM 7310]|uniref:Phage tail assembly chaperone protein, TAC n=1 Tax=Sedimentibacter hydroxybenzoicus DSM 7310 TaxID=1123245 RepID=A0A974GVX9_SEDHY|nr:hypothetical protein [Sedimentibacter hydroxybenzoicus]NYB73853.1 hypothetical protein [Sedimentibacter hydroxybenzoicus DSM 7310]
MINIEVREFKIRLNGKEYTFRLDFRALIKFEKKYGKDGLILFNNFLKGEDVYDSIIKILSCSCEEREFEETELARLLSFDFQTMQLMDKITFALVEGMITKTEGKAQKNEQASQNKNI